MQNHKKKICIIVSSPITIKAFLALHIKALSEIYQVTILVNSDKNNLNTLSDFDVEIIRFNIRRQINLIIDFGMLIKLIVFLKKEKFALIHSVTPKAGLLAMLAGLISGVPIRIHIFTGQVWANRTGIIRILLQWTDRLIVFCATNVLVDSNSQMQFLVTEKVVKPNKVSVLANGSISGVDTRRFLPDKEKRKLTRISLDIADSDIVFLFIGRLKRDKGVFDLCNAFEEAFVDKDNTHLILIGPDEDNLIEQITQLNIKKEKLHIVSYTNEPEKYMAASDILCLPSYREGFGSVIIEAAACGIPAIGSNIYGITDAISENESGLLHMPGDIKVLVMLMQELYADSDKRKNMGELARIRAERLFSAEQVTAAWLDYYAAVI